MTGRNFTKLLVLYDIISDPTESTDVSNKHRDVVNLMLMKLADYFVSNLKNVVSNHNIGPNFGLKIEKKNEI